MTLHDYIAILRRNWLLITVTTALGIALATAASLVMTPVYQATTQMFVSMSDEGDGASSAYTGALFAQQRVKSYTAVVDSPAVLEPVIEQLDLLTTPTALAPRITATAPPNTVLINVTASDTDAAQAAQIANAVAASFADEIVRLETPAGSGSSPVKPSVTQPAVEPTSPVSPRTQLNVVLGGLLGLMVGVGIAVARSALDTSVSSTDDLTEAAEATLLGVAGFDPQAKAHPLIALDHASPRSEAFRTLRTNLQYVDVDNPPRCVVVTSAIPAEGKTTTACNLAITIAQSGKRVLLVEADLRRPRVADYVGIDGSVGVTDVLIGQRSLDEVIVSWNRGLMDVLPSGSIPPNPSELLGSRQMAELLNTLAARYDTILLDAPPLLPVTDAAVLTSLADGAILITRHGLTRREQVAHAADAIRQVGGRLLGVVLNFAPVKKRTGKYGYGYGYGYGYDEHHPSRTKLGAEDLERAQPLRDDSTPLTGSAMDAGPAPTGAQRSASSSLIPGLPDRDPRGT